MLPLQSKVVAAPVIPQVAERLLEYHCGDEKRANAIICIVGCEYTSTCLVSIVNLRILLEGNNQVIICPVRSIHNMRIPKERTKKLSEGKLLFLSPFEKKFRKPTVELSRKRNLLVAALAFKILIIHAAEGSKTEEFDKTVSKWDKDIFTFDDSANARLFELGLSLSTQLSFSDFV